jgi:hypothetical protein
MVVVGTFDQLISDTKFCSEVLSDEAYFHLFILAIRCWLRQSRLKARLKDELQKFGHEAEVSCRNQHLVRLLKDVVGGNYR